uniref:EGF-like protein n=1 Tax=Pinctada fucata TaxID=50426 RepID=A0A120GZK0_PINFU|nr:EGF-like protein [Pinctada fucata]
MWQNVLGWTMGCHFIQMFLLEILILLTCVQTLPLTERDYIGRKGYEKKVEVIMKDFTTNHFEVEMESNTRMNSEDKNDKISNTFLEQLKKVKLQNKSKTRTSNSNEVELKSNERTETNSTSLSIESSNHGQNDNFDAQENRSKRRKRFSIMLSGFNAEENVVDSNFDNTHVTPCDWEHRNYCHHGGICVFVDALDIRTCRCPIAYTGPRCERLDLGYMMRSMMNGNALPFPFP